MRRQFRSVAFFVAAITAAVGLAPAAIAAATFSPQEAALAKRLEATYGVKVLRIRLGESNGLSVYIVTVMKQGGDFNDAFQVTTLAVDRSSGALVSQYSQTPTGPQHSDAESRDPLDDEVGMTMRRQTERRLRQR